MRRSVTHYKHFRSVFREGEVDTQLVRMSLLFEDLRIEHHLVKRTDRIAGIDTLSPQYRMVYFLRRSTVTLVEFMGSAIWLDQRPEFERIRRKLTPSMSREWNAAIDFFKQHKQRTKTIRDEYGGHFLPNAAREVIRRMSDKAISQIELKFENESADLRLHYAYDICAAALMVHLPDRPNSEEQQSDYLNELFTMVTTGWKHTVALMHILATVELLPRFRGEG